MAQVQFQESISEIRKVSNSVMKEVVELREANSRLKDMEKDEQRKQPWKTSAESWRLCRRRGRS
jgi:hypothetical protein